MNTIKFCLCLCLGASTLLANAEEKPQQAGKTTTAQKMPKVPLEYVGACKAISIKNNIFHRYTGTLTPISTLHITSRVNGILEKINFIEGSNIKKGDVLFEIETIRYEAAVRAAEAQVAQVKARLAYAQQTYNRNKILHETNTVSVDTLEASLSDLEAQKALLAAAEADLIVSRDDLKNTKIISEIDGKIGKNTFTVGNMITPASGVLATIIQTTPIHVTFFISQKDFLNMFGNEKNLLEQSLVKLRTADGVEYAKSGHVEIINNQASSATDSIQVWARFDNPKNSLVSGGIVIVHLGKKEADNAIAVPPSAIIFDNNGAFVYVLDSQNKVSRRNIKIGNATNSLQIITEGISLGETVIHLGTHKAKVGATVIPEMTILEDK